MRLLAVWLLFLEVIFRPPHLHEEQLFPQRFKPKASCLRKARKIALWLKNFHRKSLRINTLQARAEQ
jgi:hypothetical protein